MFKSFFALTFGLVLFGTTGLVAAQDRFPAVGDKAADFELTSIEGKPIRFHDLTAKSPVVLVVLRGYPGYQCPACSAQVRSLVSQADALGKAKVLLVYPGPADVLTSKAQEFLGGKSLPQNFELVLDPDYKFTNQYQLRWNGQNETAYPSTFVVDSKNIIRYAKVSKTHGGRASAKEVLNGLKSASK